MFKRLMIGLLAMSFIAMLLPEADAAVCIAWKKIGGKNVCVAYRPGSAVARITIGADQNPLYAIGGNVKLDLVGPDCTLVGTTFCRPPSESSGIIEIQASVASSPVQQQNASKVLVIGKNSFADPQSVKVKTGPGNLGPLPGWEENTDPISLKAAGAWFSLTEIPKEWTNGNLSDSEALSKYFVGFQDKKGNWKTQGGFGKGNDDPPKFFSQIPMREQDPKLLETGLPVCGVVYDSDISPSGSEHGKRAGLVAFRVSICDDGDCTVQPLSVADYCKELTISDQGAQEQTPIIPALTETATFNENDCTAAGCEKDVTLEVDDTTKASLCGSVDDFITFWPAEFYGRETFFNDDGIPPDILEQFYELPPNGTEYDSRDLEPGEEFPNCFYEEGQACPNIYPDVKGDNSDWNPPDLLNKYFNSNSEGDVYVEKQLGDINLGGNWTFIPIAMEAGYTIEIYNDVTGEPLFEDGLKFSTEDCSKFGLPEVFDLTDKDLWYKVVNTGNTVRLQGGNASESVKVYQILADSDLLDYLQFPVVVKAGQYLFLFEDGGGPDFDDFVLVGYPNPIE